MFAGRDARAGGTWLAVARGRIAAVTNVRGIALRSEAPSRGMLPFAALRDEVPAVVSPWNGFNLVVASLHELRVMTHDGSGESARVVRLPPGDHVIVNDPFGTSTPRVACADAALRAFGPSFDALVSHADDVETSLCRHGAEYGTVSATVVALDRDGRIAAYRHRDGHPCEAAEIDLSATARRATDGVTAGST